MLFAVQLVPFASNKQWDFQLVTVKDENKVVDVPTVIFKVQWISHRVDAYHK